MNRQLITVVTLVSVALISDYASADIELATFLKNADKKSSAKSRSAHDGYKPKPTAPTASESAQKAPTTATKISSQAQNNVERFEIIGKNGDIIFDRTRRLYWARDANIGKRPLKREEVGAFIETLNSIGYGGYKNWRLPTEDEFDILLSLSRKNGYAVLGKPAADFLNSRLPFQNFQCGLYQGKGYTINSSGEPWDDVVKRQAFQGVYLIPVRDEVSEAAVSDLTNNNKPVLELIESYKAPPFPVSEYSDREIYDNRIKHGVPNPASLKHTLACDMYCFMLNNWDITSIDRKKSSFIDLLITVDRYSKMKWGKTAGYRPWTHTNFIGNMTLEEKRRLAFELSNFITSNDISCP